MKWFFAVYQCAAHPEFTPLVIEDENGSGTRVLGGKCCKNMYGRILVRIPLNNDVKIRALIEELEAIEEALSDD